MEAELTDVEIERRLAVIAGYECVEQEGAAVIGTRQDGSQWVAAHWWHPLSDWNQLMPLLEGYNVTMLHIDGTHRCRLHSDGWNEHHGTGFGPTRKHAIARALLAAHEIPEPTAPAGRCRRCGADVLRMLDCSDPACPIPRAAHEEDSP